MTSLGYKPIDVDNHYYEPLDAFTRHLDKKFKHRGVQMLTDGRHTYAVIGERVNHFIPNPTFDPIIVPGCLDLLFRGEVPEGVDPASLMKVERLADHPEYQNRDARIAVMDSQGIETVFMLPTFACGVEEALKHDIEATMASVHAFNLWLDEDWGFDRPDHRIIAAPIISLADPEKAVDEVEFVLARGAKLVLVRPARCRCGQTAVVGRSGPRSGVGPAGRGGRASGLSSQRQRLSADRRDVGRQVDLRGVRCQGPVGRGAAR
ncbi:putative amidohydrolase [Mycobacterium xenopi 4042]|uniref:Putative amidohydrolase n=1 Tax=Mycobacterium xenopi 4042 TaxID=1299334 RepID=X8E528_MYCXE|nr:putative amidohydrolase [Mycobacterium xenopi 4042]